MKTLFAICASTLVLTSASAQQLSEDAAFARDLVNSGLVHIPLTADPEKSFKAAAENKTVLHSEPLCTLQEGLPGWTHSGIGRMAYSTAQGAGAIMVELPARSATDDIKSFADFDIQNPDWTRFNRVSFWVYPDCEGARIVHMSLLLHNDGAVEIPYKWNREGAHYVNLRNREWNHVLLEIDPNGRDRVSRFAFSFPAFGRERTMEATMRYYVDRIELQRVADPEVTVGWMPAEGRVVYSTTGYSVGGAKTAIVNMPQERHYRIVDAAGNTVYEGDIERQKTTTGEFDVLDFSAFDTAGEYRLQVGGVTTPAFRISDRLWENSLWRVTNYFFGERCGFDVPAKHTSCHLDIFAEHDGKRIMYAGGWHDAGDQAQQTLQTAEISFHLMEAYAKTKDRNPALALRMLEEARWGLEFALRTRFGDGWRASGVGNILWTDGVVGTADDGVRARVHRAAFDNFLYSGIEAHAAMELAATDPHYGDHLARVAAEDFDFAMEDHARDGYKVPRGGGHTLNTPQSQYMATISWAASMLYRLTGEQKYADTAAQYIRYTLDCQQTEPISREAAIKGFFWRDATRRVAVHYNHQSRDQIYMQAVALLVQTQPDHPDRVRWMASARLYGDYLKDIMKYTAPYGMLPSGVYRLDEADDPSFEIQHSGGARDNREDFAAQVRGGARLDGMHYVKRFPVWFSFRGNAAVHLATGKAAAVCGKLLGDPELMRIGEEQLYWLVGKNPFGQSLVYGEGHNYAQQFAVCPGELVGEVPVGVQTRLNGDEPCWPYTNNSTYKEVWGSSAGRWIALAAEY